MKLQFCTPAHHPQIPLILLWLPVGVATRGCVINITFHGSCTVCVGNLSGALCLTETWIALSMAPAWLGSWSFDIRFLLAPPPLPPPHHSPSLPLSPTLPSSPPSPDWTVSLTKYMQECVWRICNEPNLLSRQDASSGGRHPSSSSTQQAQTPSNEGLVELSRWQYMVYLSSWMYQVYCPYRE